jgi:hypothetical protein
MTANPTNAQDPIRNIRFIMPGFEATYQQEPWNPAFLKRLQGFSCIRFADATAINSSTACRWRDRTLASHANYFHQGMPYELCIDLCNRIDADAWFCVPHGADNQYIESFAGLIKEKLATNHKVYIEYSNEIWNPAYFQHTYALAQAQKLWPDMPPQGADIRFGAHRSKEVFEIIERVLGPSHKVIRVISAPAEDLSAAQAILDFESAGQSADALAIAPLLNAGRRSPDPPDSVRTTPADILSRLQNKSLSDAIAQMQACRKLAAQNNLKLIAYAAGPSVDMNLTHHGPPDMAFRQAFSIANRDPAIAPILEKYYDAGSTNGSGVTAIHPLISPATPVSLPGLLDYVDQSPKTSPKWIATLNYAKKLRQSVPSS